MTAFADRLIARARTNPLCLGLDPFAGRIPALFGPSGSIAAVEAFCAAMVDLAADRAACVKPQIGLFEPWGAAGVAVVERLAARAQRLGLPVILDAKRGDIGTTAEGYAKACLGPDPAIDADCVTVNPYMGLDSLEPFVAAAEATGKGVAVLVRTSNPGARDVQDLDAGGQPVWARVASMLAPLEARLMGSSGWSGLMAVAGATWPHEARTLRALMPRTLFLVPGYGAQGAGAADAMAGFVAGEAGLEGGVVNASRAALYPAGALEAGSAADWERIVTAGLDAIVADLRAAMVRPKTAQA